MKFNKWDIVIYDNREIGMIVSAKPVTQNDGVTRDLYDFSESFSTGSALCGVTEDELRPYPFEGYTQPCPGNVYTERGRHQCSTPITVKLGDRVFCTNSGCSHAEKKIESKWDEQHNRQHQFITSPLGLICEDTIFSANGNNLCFPFRDKERFPDTGNLITQGLVACGEALLSAAYGSFGIAENVNAIQESLAIPEDKKGFYHRVTEVLGKYYPLYYYGLKSRWEWDYILKAYGLAEEHCFWFKLRERKSSDDLLYSLQVQKGKLLKAQEEEALTVVFSRPQRDPPDAKGVAALLREHDADLLRMHYGSEEFIKLHDRELGEMFRKLSRAEFPL
jgi:hypothetical protein